MKKKTFFLSSSRADFDLISTIYNLLKKNKYLLPKIILTGTNLDKKYTQKKKFLNSNFKINVDLKSSNIKDFSKVLSSYFLKFYNFLYKKKPNVVVILGDRYETLIFAICAKFLDCKIIHIHGGEKTKGSLDNIWRDMITKISDYHFTSLEIYRKRVIKLIDSSKNVFNFGSIGAYNIKNINKKKIFQNIKFKKKILVSYHSSTLSISKSRKDLLEMLAALTKFKECFILFTYPGHDIESDFIIKSLKKFNIVNKNSLLIKKASSYNYADLLYSFDILVGNSSSGIIEAPSAKIPTLNIGDRQKGRVSGPSVFHINGNRKKIYFMIKKILKKKKIIFKNPYYQKNTLKKMSDKIISISKI